METTKVRGSLFQVGGRIGPRSEVGARQSQGKFFPGWRAEDGRMDGQRRAKADKKGRKNFFLEPPFNHLQVDLSRARVSSWSENPALADKLNPQHST